MPPVYQLGEKERLHRKLAPKYHGWKVVVPYRENEETRVRRQANEGESYEVERILDKQVKDGEELYLIKWRNYPMREATWTMRSHIDAEVVEEFEKRLSAPQARAKRKRKVIRRKRGRIPRKENHQSTEAPRKRPSRELITPARYLQVVRKCDRRPRRVVLDSCRGLSVCRSFS